MSSTFDSAFKRLLQYEGGYTNDPKDRGNWTTGVIGKGECKGTKYGISAMAYPDLDIKNLTENQAKEIYKKVYWTDIGLDKLEPCLAVQVFDAAVQHGTKVSVRLLQEIIGVNTDGILGAGTLSTIQFLNQKVLSYKYIARRLKYYVSLRVFTTYGKGWINRMASLLEDAAAENEGVSL